jgi:hypothetical protein
MFLLSTSWIHPPSGRVYSYSYKAPEIHGKDNKTGDPLVQRDDDKPDAVRARLAAYDKVQTPYASKSWPVLLYQESHTHLSGSVFAGDCAACRFLRRTRRVENISWFHERSHIRRRQSLAEFQRILKRQLMACLKFLVASADKCCSLRLMQRRRQQLEAGP